MLFQPDLVLTPDYWEFPPPPVCSPPLLPLLWLVALSTGAGERVEITGDQAAVELLWADIPIMIFLLAFLSFPSEDLPSYHTQMLTI